jgi:cold shock CspA family protein
MTDSTTTVTSSNVSQRLLGRVKWFNNRAGYGFITVTDGPKAGLDIFVHHSSIRVDSEQYRYLVQGEYVEFTLLSTPGGQHEYQGGEVSGLKGGKLMCETRRDVRVSRTHFHSQDVNVNVRPPTRTSGTRGGFRTRGRGRGSQRV